MKCFPSLVYMCMGNFMHLHLDVYAILNAIAADGMYIWLAFHDLQWEFKE